MYINILYTLSNLCRSRTPCLFCVESSLILLMENNKKILYMFNPLCGQYMDNIVKSKALSDFLETEINLEKNPTMKPVFCIKKNCTAINL